jgi:SAM-dependent methyltransferase
MNAVTPIAGAEPLDPLLDTTSTASLGIWHEVLTLQVELFLPHEVASLARSPAWRQAASVVEAGCGNGDYLAGLHRFFPGKRYLGLDVSGGLVGLANARHGSPGLAFAVSDFLADRPAGHCDALVMRFIIQHLSSLPEVLAQAACHLKPGGSLFVIEPDLAECANMPQTPVFEGMLAEHARHSVARGRLRALIGDLPGLIGATPDWGVERDDKLTVQASGPFTGGKLLRLYLAWVGLCETQGLFAYDFAAVRRELDDWGRSPASFSRIGLRMIEARYRPDFADRLSTLGEG